MCPVRAILAACLCGALLLWSAEGRAAPVPIRVAWAVVPADVMALAFEKKELLRHYGKSYDVTLTQVRGSSVNTEALAAGETDIAVYSYAALGTAIVDGGLTDLRVIADCYQDGTRGHFSTAFLVRKDSPIATVEDLEGKVLATNGMGGASDIAMRAMLRRHHLEEKRDYTIVLTRFSDMQAMLDLHKADLIAAAPLFYYGIAASGTARTLFTQEDAVGPSQTEIYVARAGFIEKNRAALVDLFEDVLRMQHWYFDPANRAAMLEILSRVTRMPVGRLAGWVYTKKDHYHDPNAIPDLAVLQHNLDMEKDLGLLKADFDIRNYIDLSIVAAAANRLW